MIMVSIMILANIYYKKHVNFSRFVEHAWFKKQQLFIFCSVCCIFDTVIYWRYPRTYLHNKQSSRVHSDLWDPN